MNTKQKKQMKLSLTKRLMMGMILSVAVGSTAAMGGTKLITDPNVTNGCPTITNTTTSSLNSYYLSNSTSSAFPASPYDPGSKICWPAGQRQYTFDVYKQTTGILPYKGTVTVQLLDLTCAYSGPQTQAFIVQQSSNITWISGVPSSVSTQYDPSSYLACFVSGS
jgi:hypothetical protein